MLQIDPYLARLLLLSCAFFACYQPLGGGVTQLLLEQTVAQIVRHDALCYAQSLALQVVRYFNGLPILAKCPETGNHLKLLLIRDLHIRLVHIHVLLEVIVQSDGSELSVS